MRPVKAEQRPRKGSRKGPGPSKLAFRLERAWKKPWLRSLVMVYLPFAVLAALGWRVAAEDKWRLAVQAEIESWTQALAARPEFAVEGVAVTGGTGELRAEVRRLLGPLAGVSSLTLDLGALRARIEAVGAVKTARVRFDPTGKLSVALEARRPVALWRGPDGALSLVDEEGVAIAAAERRVEHPGLPLVIGAGAKAHVAEALRLIEIAPPIRPRLRAMARVGERRWDVVLDRGLVIMLPEEGAAAALAGAMALHYSEELLERNLAAIDLRVHGRPALRMAPEAAEQLILERALAEVLGEET